MAYSLLGILQVNMPTLYGEGTAAFARLQGEVIRKCNDLSIFSWVGEPVQGEFLPVLAPSPSHFIIRPAGDHRREQESAAKIGNQLGTQFSLTNQGIFFPSAKLQYQNEVAEYRHRYLLDLGYMSRKSHRRYLALQKVGPGLFVRLPHTEEHKKAFWGTRPTAPFYEAVCILNNLPSSILRQLRLWERHAVRLRWKPWHKPGRQFFHVRAAEPRSSWDIAANQFLLELAPEPSLRVEFIPGNHDTNPESKYLVVTISVGNESSRDPAVISARLCSANDWERSNRTLLGFRNEAFKTIQGTACSGRISLVGYDISLSTRLVTDGQLPCHQVYLDWEMAAPEAAGVLPQDV